MLFEHMASCESDSLIFMGTTRGGLVMGSRPVRTLLDPTYYPGRK